MLVDVESCLLHRQSSKCFHPFLDGFNHHQAESILLLLGSFKVIPCVFVVGYYVCLSLVGLKGRSLGFSDSVYEFIT